MVAVLITDGSMISGIDEKYYNKITIIFHVGTNDCVNEYSRIVLDKILNFRTFIQSSALRCK